MPELESILSKVNDIPTLPDVVLKITRMIADPATTASDINEVLSHDPALTAKILKLVNSPYYGFARRITNITNAVVILGYNQVRNLALSAFVFDILKVKNNLRSFDMTALWRHSIGSAFIASALSKKLKIKAEEDAFICGLLHDLGKGIMAQHAVGDLEKVMMRVITKDILFIAAERESLQYTHAEIGASIMEKWNLSESLVSAIRFHHDPLSAPESARMLAVITNFSDILARAVLMGSGGDDKIPRLLPEVWEFLGLTWDDVNAIIRQTAEEYWKSDEFLSIA